MPISLDRFPETLAQKRQAMLKRVAVFAGFILLIALLLGNAYVVRRQIDILVGNERWVDHTRQVLLDLSRTDSLLKDAETGQRGYLYTGEARYLAPYDLAITQIDAEIDTIARLTADNPRQQARIPELRSLAHAKLDELRHTIALSRAGKQQDARELVKSDLGLVTMDKIRDVLNRMEQEESALDIGRTKAFQKSVGITVGSIYLASGVALIGLCLLAYTIVADVQHRERFLREIQRREEWYRVTLTGIGDAVIATTADGMVTFLNPVAETLTGFALTAARGRSIHEVFPIFNEYTNQQAQSPVQKVIELGTVVGLANHTVLKRADGAVIPIEDSAAPIRDDRGNLVGVVMVFHDVTSIRKSLDVLRKTEKLAAAARLAASMAHEINNPLEAVVNLIFLAKSAPDAPPAVVQSLTMAEEELARVAHLTRQTLGFYRESNQPERVEMPALVDSVLGLYANKIRNRNIKVNCHFASCPPLRCVPGEVKQVISNLLANAVDAVDRGGSIQIRTWCTEQDEEQMFHMEIEDDGPGIAPELIDQIFEPFFTTKKDVGTGLGLWVTREILSRHGGSIEVTNRSSNSSSSGAVFRIVMPCSADIPAFTGEASTAASRPSSPKAD